MIEQTVIGWREWVQIPEFGDAVIKAKVDTGAATSSLHAFNVVRHDVGGVPMVDFEIYPRQRSKKKGIRATAVVVKEQKVRNPGGRSELRPVISTTLVIAGRSIEALVNLTGRDEMGFRMLIGRRTIRPRFVVDPGRSYLGGRLQKETRT